MAGLSRPQRQSTTRSQPAPSTPLRRSSVVAGRSSQQQQPQLLPSPTTQSSTPPPSQPSPPSCALPPPSRLSSSQKGFKTLFARARLLPSSSRGQRARLQTGRALRRMPTTRCCRVLLLRRSLARSIAGRRCCRSRGSMSLLLGSLRLRWRCRRLSLLRSRSGLSSGHQGKTFCEHRR